MLTEITEGTSNTDAASLDTASFTPAVGQLFFIAGKRTDTAAMTSDDWVITQTGSTWDLVTTRLYTGTSAYRLSVFRCSSAGSAAVASMTVDTAVNLNRRRWSVQEPSSPLNGTVVQSAVNSNTFSTTPGVTLGAFGDAANWTVLCAAQDGGTGTFTAESVDWTTPTDQGPGVFVVTYLDANDTTPSGTWNTNRTWGAIGLELQAAAAGPTIDTQPTAQTAMLHGEPTTGATFTVSATTSGGALSYDWELETSVGGGVYANLSDGLGAVWTGQAAASCTGTFSATTLTGRRVRCNVTDSNGTVTTNAVTLTILNGPVLSAYSGTTNGSGVSTLTITSDDALTTNGEVYRVTVTMGSVTKRIYVRAT